MSEHITEETVKTELDNLVNEAGSDPVEVALQQSNQISTEKNQSEWKEIVQMIAVPAFGLLAPNWNISPPEVEALAESYAVLLDKYFPDGAVAMGPELGAAMVTIAIIGPRLSQPRKLPKPKEVKDQEPEKGAIDVD